MPISTNLNAPPYRDTYSPANDFYRIAFQPGVSVQARELNELQSMFAAQVERFGDNIFSTGTIVSGCNFVFLNPYPYVKLADQDVFGNPVSPSAYVNSAILNTTTGLTAQVLDYADGFVSSDPNLKTLYLKYMNTGNDSNTQTFAAGDNLLVYDRIRNGLESITVVAGGSGFSNSEQSFAVSALAVTPLSGTVANGQYIGNGLGANVQVIGVDNSTLAAQGQVVLSVAPRPEDLANAQLTSSAWTIANGQAFTTSGNTASGVVASVIGSGYSGLVITDSLGTIQKCLILNKGVGYWKNPFITTRSANNASGYSALNLTSQNYIAKITVATTSGAVGNGYAFGINEGVVYLKGHFLRVSPQSVLVSKYDQVPDGVSVIFSADETIIDYNLDPSLNDPAAGENNGAPGADRLKIIPKLKIVTSTEAASNAHVLSLVDWNEGNPYSQKQPSQYSTIGDAMATQVYDQSGNFYIDPFLVTTSTIQANNAQGLTPIYFDIVIDPGSAYIGGRKVQTDTSYIMGAPYQAESAVVSYNTSLNYGNYLVVKELGGTFQYNTAAQVTLYSQPKGYISNASLVKTANTAPQGVAMGTAQLRGLNLATGIPGTNAATYNMYLFDIQMNPGQNFGNVASIYYNGTNKGICDVVQTVNQTTGLPVTTLVDPSNSRLVFQTGRASVKNVNAASYQVTALDQTVTVANSGILTKSLASSGQTFPWFGATLTSAQAAQLYVVPTSVDLVSSANIGGTWFSNSSLSYLVANTGGTALTDLVAGDWITLLGNSTQIELHQVTQVANNGYLVLDSAPSFINTATAVARTYPKNLPIPISTRAGCSANVSANGTVLSVNLGFPIAKTTTEPMTIGYPVVVSNTSPTTKTVNRNAFVKFACSNNAGNTVGPWCLGVPDAFRLRGVYVGNSSVSNTGINYVSMFSIDNNQTPDFLDLSWLYMDNGVVSPLSSGSTILVQFDYYTTTGSGFYATPSYTHSTNVTTIMLQDAQPLANLTSAASTWEVPEFFTDSGIEVDLLGCLDFRPYAQSTVTPGVTPAAAPLNPVAASTFDTTEKLFPVPGTTFSSSLNYYTPRMDTIYVDGKGGLQRLQGISLSGSGQSPTIPSNTMKITDILLPEYPNLPANRTVDLTQVINTGIVNTKYATNRISYHSISLLSSITQNADKVYTNRDVADIDRRLKNVEYYVNLTELESSVKTMVIPSSGDPSVNRYQFGFFADDFTTTDLSDRSNPGYVALKENGDIVPSKLTWEVFMGDAFTGSQSYVTNSIISQQNATIGDHTDPLAVPQCAVSLANSVAYQLVYRNAYDYNSLPPQDGSVDVVSFTLADSAHMSVQITDGARPRPGIDSAGSNNLGTGQVTLWFYAYDNPVAFQILQGSTVVADSSSAVPLSSTDVTNLTTGTVLNQWFNDQPGVYLKNPVNTTGALVKYAGKVVWNYNGVGGNTFSIRTTNGAGVRNWRWVVSYPINGETAGCVPPPPPLVCPDGYYYDPNSGGCIIIPPVIVPPRIIIDPPVLLPPPIIIQPPEITPPIIIPPVITPPIVLPPVVGRPPDIVPPTIIPNNPPDIVIPGVKVIDPGPIYVPHIDPTIVVVPPVIITPPVIVTTPILPPVIEVLKPKVDIHYVSCGNQVTETVWPQIMQALQSGADIGTIVVADNIGISPSVNGHTDFVGSFADYINPTSPQSLLQLEKLATSTHTSMLSLAQAGNRTIAGLYAAYTGQPFGTYSAHDGHAYYTAPDGKVTQLQDNGSLGYIGAFPPPPGDAYTGNDPVYDSGLGAGVGG